MIDLNHSRNLAVRWLACCLRLPLALPMLTAVLVLATPVAVHAQFNYTVTNQTVTITGYTGTNGVVAIPSTINGLPVTSIGDNAFGNSGLTNITIPNSVTSIGDEAFIECKSLTRVYFQGNAPRSGSSLFSSDSKATAYYMPGTTGWGSTYGGIPTAIWSLPYPLILNSSLGVRSNEFGFRVSWATNASVIVEASADLNNPKWSPVQTNVLNNGVVNFTDPEWNKNPSRFYRVRSQ